MATCFACFGKVAQSAPDQSHSLSWDVCAGPLSQRNLPEPVRATTARTSGAFFLTDIRALARCCCCFSYLSGCEWLWTDSWSCCIQVNEGPSPSRFAGLPTSVVSGGPMSRSAVVGSVEDVPDSSFLFRGVPEASQGDMQLWQPPPST